MASQTDTSTDHDHSDSDSSDEEEGHHEDAQSPAKINTPLLSSEPKPSDKQQEIKSLPPPPSSHQRNNSIGGSRKQSQFDQFIKPRPVQAPTPVSQSPQPPSVVPVAAGGSLPVPSRNSTTAGNNADQRGTTRQNSNSDKKQLPICVFYFGVIDLIGSLLLCAYIMYGYVPLLIKNDSSMGISESSDDQYHHGFESNQSRNSTVYLVTASVLLFIGAVVTCLLMVAVKKNNSILIGVWSIFSFFLFVPSVWLSHATDYENISVLGVLVYCTGRFIVGLCFCCGLCCADCFDVNQPPLPYYGSVIAPATITNYPVQNQFMRTVPVAQIPQQQGQLTQTGATPAATMPPMYGYSYPGMGGVGIAMSYPAGWGVHGGSYGSYPRYYGGWGHYGYDGFL